MCHSHMKTTAEHIYALHGAVPPREANSHLSGHEILRILRKPKAHSRVHKIPPMEPILRQMSAVKILL
jgi:hypothetical protein